MIDIDIVNFLIIKNNLRALIQYMILICVCFLLGLINLKCIYRKPHALKVILRFPVKAAACSY